MTIFLLILAILLVGGTALLASGRRLPSRMTPKGAARTPSVGGMSPAVASLPPVLLPERPTARDVDALRFGLGLRGYRMDQVDQVLDRLAEALSERDAIIDDLRRRPGTDSPRDPSRS